MVVTVRRGRPRNVDADQRILAAATRSLLDGGYHRFTIDEVAAAAGVAKTTLYRRWPTKDHLAAAVVAGLQDDVPVGDSADLEAELNSYLGAIAAGLTALRDAGNADDGSPGTVAEMVAATGRHADLGRLSRAQFAKRNAQGIGMLSRAVDAGRLRDDVDPGVLFEQLAGALYYRVLLSGEPIDSAYVHRLVRNALTGLLIPQGEPT
jgi:AcrR family transcriptional regulator